MSDAPKPVDPAKVAAAKALAAQLRAKLDLPDPDEDDLGFAEPRDPATYWTPEEQEAFEVRNPPLEMPDWDLQDGPPQRELTPLERMEREERERYEAFHRGDKPNGQYRNGHDQSQKIEAFDTVRASSFHGQVVPEVAFLDARKMFPMGHASILTGATKVGKTYVALQAAVACTTGTNWLNEPIRQGPVIFYSAEEDISVLHMRLDKICQAEGIYLSALDDLHIVNLSSIINAALIKGDNRTETITETDLYKRLDLTMHILKPVSVWIDNRGLVVTGSEASRSMQAAAARAFQMLANRHGCSIGMLQHPSQRGEENETGSSGSTAIFAGYRSVVHMKRVKDDRNARVLENELTNYTASGTQVNMAFEFGRYICTDQPKRPGDDIGQADKAERVFLKLLRRITADGMGDDLSPLFKSAASYAPRVFAGRSDCEKVTVKQFMKAMESLMDRGVIEVAERGPPSRRVKFVKEVLLNF